MAAAGQEVEGLTRDLEAAKAAYAEGSAEASKAAHDGGAKRSPEEHSNTPSEFIKVRLMSQEENVADALAWPHAEPRTD
jgi:hypothetical protein